MGGGAWTAFDITSLAKQWKSGAQNGQCGFIMIGAEEETKKIGALSCEYTNSAYWPYVVVTYIPKIMIGCENIEVKVNYGAQLTVTTTPMGMDVSWASSDSTIATVSSSGVIFAHKAGVVTIVASVTDEDGEMYTDTCIVYVCLADGVYYFQNMYSGYYLGVRNGAISDQTPISQQALANEETAELQYYSQLWKVKHLGSGYYSIRPMHMLSSALCAPSSSVMIRDIGAEDTGVLEQAKWAVQYYQTGYVLQCAGNSGQTLVPYGFSGSANAAVYTTTFSGESVAFRWMLTPLTDISDKLLLIDTENNVALSTATRYVAPEESRTMEEMGLAVSFVSASTNTQAITWSIGGASGDAVTYSVGDNTITGILSSQSCLLNFNVSRNGTLHTKSIAIHVTAIPNGTYFVQNEKLENYLQIDNNSDISANNAVMELWDFDGEDDQKWVFTHLHNGYYNIVSEASGLALTVQPDYLNTADKSIVQQGYTGLNSQQWNISKSDGGTFIIRPRTGEGYDTDWCMAAATGILSNGRKVLQSAYYNDSDDKDEWLLLEAIYGIQQFVEIDTSKLGQINCHGYAMMRDDWPEDWIIDTAAYLSTIDATSLVGNNDYSDAIKSEISEATKNDFERWLTHNGYTWEYEVSFTGNGEYRTLESNQYRVVLRTGLHNLYIGEIPIKPRYDYHFWYQTYDGRWANKHGGQECELLPNGTTPASTDSSGWTFTWEWENEVIPYENFYDGTIYCYIITIAGEEN